MLIAALRCRSCRVPQSLHCQFLSRRFNVSLTTPQTRAPFTGGIPLINAGDFDTFFLAIYTNFLTKSAKPKSDTLRPQRAFMPCKLRVSIRISSYWSVSRCASFQWKSSRCRSILRCLRAKSSRARSRWFDCFLVRACAQLARLIALRLHLKN